jgi:hypothetical protein
MKAKLTKGHVVDSVDLSRASGNRGDASGLRLYSHRDDVRLVAVPLLGEQPRRRR